MKKAISTELNRANIDAVMSILTASPAELEHLSKSLSPEALRQPLGEGERSFTEDLAHLINGEARSSEMIYMALFVDKPLFAPIHPDRDIGKLLRYDLLDIPELLTYFKVRRAVMLRVLNTLTDTQWARVIREENKQRTESVYWRARTIALHELDHVQDMKKKLWGGSSEPPSI